VRLINITDRVKFSELANRDLRPGAVSADIDAAGLFKALEKVISCCRSNFCIRLNKKERSLLDRLDYLSKAGNDASARHVQKQPTPLEVQLKKDEAAKAIKIASIRALRQKEKAITEETTYASRKDIDDAKSKSLSMQGEVKAKKLDKKQDEQISLSDLIGDNKFIEESAKHSHISMVVASEDGWDMDKLNAPKADAPAADTPAAQDAAAPKQTDKPAKKTSRRKKESEQ
jgi:hypothetical protein